MTTTTHSRTHVSNGCLAEYEAFAELIEGLTEKEWNAAARCTGWQTRDVAGHVVGLAEDTAAGVPGSRNADEEAASVRHETPAGAAARLRTATASLRALLDVIDDDAWAGPSGVPDLTLGDGVLTLWYDTYVHADDIRAALGRPSEQGPGLAAAVAYLDAMHATRAITVDPAVDVEPLAFVLAATGRLDATTVGLDPSVNIYAE